jgi:LuxR family maltose regulon positive regulatory protein
MLMSSESNKFAEKESQKAALPDLGEAVQTLLYTKLLVPSLPDLLVPRTRLIQQLTSMLTERLTVLSAPAGFGKTTLLSQWARQSPVAIAWLSLDEQDNEISRFWNYCLAALEQVQPGVSRVAQSLLFALPRSPIESVLTALVNVLNHVPGALILVLDDYHLITAQEIHASLGFFLKHQPSCVHLIIASRAEVPIPLARLRADRHVAEVDVTDLRFTVDEAEVFLRKSVKLSLPPEVRHRISSLTEGWIAGLQLTALSLQRQENVPGWLTEVGESQPQIFDYLAEEVLSHLSPALRAFLLATSVCERLCGPLCDAITDRNQGWQFLEQARSANLFLVPLDEQRIWYRYHHLFKSFLQQRLHYYSSPITSEEIQHIHQRAFRWLEQHGQIEEAIPHALAANNYEVAAQFIERLAYPLFARGEAGTLLHWIQRLPDEILPTYPRLKLLQGWGFLFLGQVERVTLYLRDLERSIEILRLNSDLASQHFYSEYLLMRAVSAVFSYNISSIINMKPGLLINLPEEKHFLYWIVQLAQGHSHFLQGELEKAAPLLTEVQQYSRVGGSSLLLGLATEILGYIRREQGKLQQAEEVYRGTGEFSRKQPVFWAAYVGMSYLMYERNEVSAAVSYARTAVELAAQFALPEAIFDSYMALAYAIFAEGNLEEALQTIQHALQLGATHHIAPIAITLAQVCQVRLFLARSDLAAALQWVHQRELAFTDVFSYAREPEHLVLVRILFAQQRFSEAQSLLSRLLPFVWEGGRLARTIELLILQALVQGALGEQKQALISLEQALVLGEPEGTFGPLLMLVLVFIPTSSGSGSGSNRCRALVCPLIT